MVEHRLKSVSLMYWDLEVTPEEEEELIMKVAEKIHQSGMDLAALLLIETIKPLAFVGAQMGRFFLSPFLPVFGEDIGMSGEKLLQVFEKHANVEKLLTILEELKSEDKKKREDERKAAEDGEEPTRKGWRRFLPF